jgi:hypothetical protein
MAHFHVSLILYWAFFKIADKILFLRVGYVNAKPASEIGSVNDTLFG